MKSDGATIWILVGNRQGDNNQLYALANALDLPFVAKKLTYNWCRNVSFLRGERLIHLSRRSRRTLVSPWPDLVIGLGYDSVAVSRYIRRKSGGRTRLVQIGNPRTGIVDIDLVMITPQYRLEPAPNVLRLPFPIGNPGLTARPSDEEQRWLRAFPSPRRLLAVGGSTRQWQIDVDELDRAIAGLQSKCAGDGGSIIAAISRRTPLNVICLLEARLKGGKNACVESFPRFGALLAQCDEFYVTADSVSMLSEAILTGKPVGMIPIARSTRGRLDQWLRRLGWHLPSHADLTKFWDFLARDDLMGTVDSPVSSKVSDTVDVAVRAVRAVLDPTDAR